MGERIVDFSVVFDITLSTPVLRRKRKPDGLSHVLEVQAERDKEL